MLFRSGLSQNYQDWPGKTQIVIPLSDLSGGISTIDTSLISDQTVVDSMRETDSKGVDERKNMLDLKNREADQAETQAKENQLQYEKNEEKIAESEKQLEQEKQEESELKEQIEQDKQNLENAENNEEKQEAQEKLSEDEKKLSEKQEEIARTEQDIEEIKSENQSLKASSQEKQSFADKKRDEASSDTENIAKDQKDVIDTKNKNDAVKNAIYGLKLNDEKLKTSSIVKIDSDTGRIISESEIDVIRGRIFYENNDEFICIAGINSGNGAVKLVSIDKEAMTISISSELSVYEDSVFVQSQGFYFVVVQNQDGYKLAKFDSTLNICALSEIEVNPNTPAIITEKGIIAQDKSGTIIIFDEKTLLTK